METIRKQQIENNQHLGEKIFSTEFGGTPHLDISAHNSTNLLNAIGHDFELQSVATQPDDVFTVQQAVNAFGFGWFHVKLSLFVGLCWMSDSMEMAILSIIGPAMHCEWNITKFQQACTTTLVFVGMMLSNRFWTELSDRYGRRPALTLCGVLLVLYSLLSSVAPSFTWLLILRFLVGFAIGCVPQSVTLYAEFLPTKHKGKCVILMDCFWAFGACFECALALAVYPTLGWRWLLGLSAAPLLLFTTLTPWLPESARFHALNGRCDKALKVLTDIAQDNQRHMLIGRLVTDGETTATGSLTTLLKSGFRRTTLSLFFIWMACAFLYYGLVLMSTELIVIRRQSGQNETSFDESVGSSAGASSNNCEPFDTNAFMDLLWISLAEFPGIFTTIAIIKRFGKKRTMVLQFIVFSGCVMLLGLNESRTYTTFVLILARGVISGLFQAAYIYTPEVYPTYLRSLGVFGCSLLARIGAMATPFVAQVIIQVSIMQVLIIYSTMGLLASIACSCLPGGLPDVNTH